MITSHASPPAPFKSEGIRSAVSSKQTYPATAPASGTQAQGASERLEPLDLSSFSLEYLIAHLEHAVLTEIKLLSAVFENALGSETLRWITGRAEAEEFEDRFAAHRAANHRALLQCSEMLSQQISRTPASPRREQLDTFARTYEHESHSARAQPYDLATAFSNREDFSNALNQYYATLGELAHQLTVRILELWPSGRADAPCSPLMLRHCTRIVRKIQDSCSVGSLEAESWGKQSPHENSEATRNGVVAVATQKRVSRKSAPKSLRASSGYATSNSPTSSGQLSTHELLLERCALPPVPRTVVERPVQRETDPQEAKPSELRAPISLSVRSSRNRSSRESDPVLATTKLPPPAPQAVVRPIPVRTQARSATTEIGPVIRTPGVSKTPALVKESPQTIHASLERNTIGRSDVTGSAPSAVKLASLSPAHEALITRLGNWGTARPPLSATQGQLRELAKRIRAIDSSPLDPTARVADWSQLRSTVQTILLNRVTLSSELRQAATILNLCLDDVRSTLVPLTLDQELAETVTSWLPRGHQFS